MNAETLKILGKLPVGFFEDVGRMYDESGSTHDQLHADIVTSEVIRIASPTDLIPATLSAYIHDIGCCVDHDIHEHAGVALAKILNREYHVQELLELSDGAWSSVLDGIRQHRSTFEGPYSSTVPMLVTTADRAPPALPIELYVNSYKYAKRYGQDHQEAVLYAFKEVPIRYGIDSKIRYPWIYYETYEEQLQYIHHFIEALTLDDLNKHFERMGIHE